MLNRRGLLTRIVQGFGITGFGFLSYPFIKAWIPKFENDLSLEVRIDDLLPGQLKTVHWLGRNLFVLRRTQAELGILNQAETLILLNQNSRYLHLTNLGHYAPRFLLSITIARI
jgi:Rieske Fe-S protein